jgi:hypothetical protein
MISAGWFTGHIMILTVSRMADSSNIAPGPINDIADRQKNPVTFDRVLSDLFVPVRLPLLFEAS